MADADAGVIVDQTVRTGRSACASSPQTLWNDWKVVGGGDAWLVVIQRPDTAGLLPGFLSVRRDFRPGLSSASRESGV